MEETKSCLICCILDGEGAGTMTELSAIADDNPDFIWIHLNGKHPDARKYLRDRLHLDPLVVKALLADAARPRIEDLGDNTLMILRGLNFNPGPEPEDLVSVRFWISKNRIVTVSRRKSQAVGDLESRIRHGIGPKTKGEFVALLCNSICDTIEPALGELEDSIDAIEDAPLDRPDGEVRNDISSLRKQAILFKRHLTPQRDVMTRLASSPQGWIGPSEKWFLQENIDRLTRFLEDLDALRERAGVLQDELASAVSMRLNKNLYVLSIITAVFMPLSFLTGLLGMNVSGIPFSESSNAFLTVCSVACALAVFQLWLFRKLKWF